MQISLYNTIIGRVHYVMLSSPSAVWYFEYKFVPWWQYLVNIGSTGRGHIGIHVLLNADIPDFKRTHKTHLFIRHPVFIALCPVYLLFLTYLNFQLYDVEYFILWQKPSLTHIPRLLFSANIPDRSSLAQITLGSCGDTPPGMWVHTY